MNNNMLNYNINNNNLNNNNFNFNINNNNNMMNKNIGAINNNINIINNANNNMNNNPLNNNQFNNVQINNNNLQPNKFNIKSESIEVCIQCLYNCEELTNNLLNLYNDYCQEEFFPLTSIFINILKNNKNNLHNKTFFLAKLKQIIEKNFKYPSDEPKYILLHILENIHKEIKNPVQQKNNQFQYNKNNQIQCFNYFYNTIFNPDNTSVISKKFFGIKETISICPRCGNSFEYEIFKILEFSFDEIIMRIPEKMMGLMQDKSYNRINNYLNKKKIFLKECFDCCYNSNLQKNIFVCKKCSQNNKTYYLLKMIPDVLCIVINKNSQLVSQYQLEFPESFDISDYLNYFPKVKYDLFGIIRYVNDNNKITYFAHTKDGVDERWYCDKGNNSFPHILFYKKINNK
jgi:hypothetical protein